MIKVLYKAFGILELIADSPHSPKSITELAESSGLNQPTTARILKDLVNMGYVEQISRSKGYVLGPMASQISSKGAYMEDLLQIAKPLVKQCAETVKQSVLLSVLKCKKRYILCHENYNPGLNITIDSLYYRDFYGTATGRVQVAYLAENELKELVNDLGLPKGKLWDVTDFESLKAANEKVKEEGFFMSDNSLCTMTVMGFPVFENGKYKAALGASMPIFASQEEKDFVFNKVRETASLITMGLSKVQAFG